MKEGYIIKSSVPNNENMELELINKYTRRKLTSDEVYTFSVVLCDNEIDREFERFTKESLEALATLFNGKTGILDHQAKSDNQKARIFACRVEAVENKLNSIGEQYYRLVARAYMPCSEKNNDFILEIDSGIKKEVSVGCAVGKITCSVCGTDLKYSECHHTKGKSYDGKICHALLENPTDAYEWSFVAVPAQKEAGVIKAFDYKMKGGDVSMEEIIKQLGSEKEITISKSQSVELSKFISDLKKEAEDGRAYRNELKREVVRLCSFAQPELDNKIMENVTSKMSISELKAFKKAFITKANEVIPQKPQLFSYQRENFKKQNTEFKI